MLLDKFCFSIIKLIMFEYIKHIKIIKKMNLLLKYSTNLLHTHKHIPQTNNRNILITAALPYVNNTPHLGNIIGGILSADVYARYCRMMTYNVIFICGTDQYGTTTQVKALQEKMSQKQICDKYHKLHREIYQWFRISYDYFGRTTSSVHAQLSQEVFWDIYRNGAMEKKQCAQFYCVGCRMNLADRYVKGECSGCGEKAKGDQCDNCSKVFKQPTKQLNNPKCSICSQTPQITTSQHLYLKFSQINTKIQQWISSQQNNNNNNKQEENVLKKWSKNAQGVIKGWLNNKLEDRCITRDLKWGVPVPSQIIENKVMYVWFEAPIGYISMTKMLIGDKWKQWWQPQSDISVELNQFMGKDNIMFHSIMAPATLMATNQPWVRPYRISATQYLMFEGSKFSKSNNFGVFGNDCIEIGLQPDIWRYCLLSNRPQTYDSQFTWQYLATRTNKDLVNTLGNMCQRILKYIKTKLSNKNPQFFCTSLKDSRLTQLDLKFLNRIKHQFQEYLSYLENVQLKAGCHKLIEISSTVNKYLQDSQFWTKQNVIDKRNQLVIGVCMNVLYMYARVMEPYLPETSQKLLKIMNRKPINNNIFMSLDNRGFEQKFYECIMGKIFPQNQINLINDPQILFNPNDKLIKKPSKNYQKNTEVLNKQIKNDRQIIILTYLYNI